MNEKSKNDKSWITEEDKKAIRYSDGKKGKDSLKHVKNIFQKRKDLD